MARLILPITAGIAALAGIVTAVAYWMGKQRKTV